MERRQFLISSCNFCLLTAAGAILSELSSCSPAYQVFKTDIVNDAVKLPLASFNNSAWQFVRPKGWYYDIAVQKKDQAYEALLMQCTHQNNQLMPTGNGFTCSLHGSQFDKDGLVTKGPAEITLKKYNVSVVQDNLIIHLKN
jgi:Rieske Fe-S protein